MRTLTSLFCLLVTAPLHAEAPVASYLFPAGGQRGTSVDVLAGGLFLNKSCRFEVVGKGVTGPEVVKRIAAPVFEGPVLPLPESQRQEDYPQAMGARLTIAPDAAPGNRYVRLWTSQGVTAPLPFVVGELPEIVERETEGEPVPVLVSPPVTVNGRIHPREDVDVWAVRLKQGQTLTCAVAATSLGSPLEALLEVRDARGRVLAESRDGLRPDPTLHFTAPADGEYAIRITDTRGDGGPAFVYRLTLTTGPFIESAFPLGGRRGTTTRFHLTGHGLASDTAMVAVSADAPATFTHNGLRLDIDDLPEATESAEDDPVRGNFLPLPGVGNGRIAKPGEVDEWKIAAKAGEALAVELRAFRLGSPLLGVLSVRDAAGKPVAQAEAGPAGDPVLRFTAPANGTYTVAVRDKFRGRGGPAFAYRLRVTRPSPGIELQIASASLTIARGQQVPLKITATRHGNANGPIHLALDGLPPGVTAAKEAVIPAGQTSLDLPLKADAAAKIGAFPLRVRGVAYQPLLPFTAMPVPLTSSAVIHIGDDVLDHVRVAVALPTPFKIAGDYTLQLVPRGTVYSRRFRIERNGYAEPIEIDLADKQARHLQGVSAKPMIVPPDKNEFEYAITLPPWMETGRTCRVCVMGTATVKEADGSEHVVTFSSREQNEQVIAVVEPERLGLRLDRETLRVEPGATAEIVITLGRGEGLSAPAKIEVVIPSHFRGVTAEPLEFGTGATEGKLKLRFAADAKGPFNAPLVIRAVVTDKGLPVTAETKLELVAP
jgi:hypothetical protein